MRNFISRVYIEELKLIHHIIYLVFDYGMQLTNTEQPKKYLIMKNNLVKIRLGKVSKKKVQNNIV